jgi:hypothetical protein
MQRDRLIHRVQVVVSVLPQRTDVQSQINLGERPNRDRHEAEIVSEVRLQKSDCRSLKADFPDG